LFTALVAVFGAIPGSIGNIVRSISCALATGAILSRRASLAAPLVLEKVGDRGIAAGRTLTSSGTAIGDTRASLTATLAGHV
jgi:hypothetical protein